MKKLFLSFILSVISSYALAYDLCVDGIYYNVTSTTEKTLEVEGSSYYGSVTIPEKVTRNSITYTVTSIGEYAFYKCSSLISVTIPKSVTNVGFNAFHECTSLKSVHISDIGSWCNIDFAIYECNPLYYAKHLYLGDEEITDLVIPSTVTSIKSDVFYKCSSIKSVTIPNSVTSIGAGSFLGCSGLTSITIPNSVTSIYNYAFEGCI